MDLPYRRNCRCLCHQGRAVHIAACCRPDPEPSRPKPDLSGWVPGARIRYRHLGHRIEGNIDVGDPELLAIGMVDFLDDAGIWYVVPVERCRLISGGQS